MIWGPAARSELLINEFLPDPDGADGGREYVELINTGSQAVDLLGVGLEFANGIEGAVWDSRWICTESTALGPGDLFLLVDRNWMGEVSGQVEVWLGLQNGPDAIRIVRNQQVLDLVGYGPLTDPEIMETSPASVVPGLAVARRPDGWDTGNNGLDFVSHTPTPGQPNFLPFALNLQAFSLDPPSADRSGMGIVAMADLVNIGTENLPTAPILLRCFGTDHEALLDANAPGESRSVAWFLESGLPGRWPIEIQVVAEAAPEVLVMDAGSYQVGPAQLFLNEVLPAPGDGQGEWVELAVQGQDPVFLQDYQLKEEDGTWQELPDYLLHPGDLVVLAQDPAGLEDWLEANNMADGAGECSGQGANPLILGVPGSWPNLNNTAPESRDFADRVYLADGSGTVVDNVTLGLAGTETVLGSGVSWERIAPLPLNPGGENWAPCTSLVTSTPGCPNSVSGLPGGSGRLTVSPAILDPEQGVSTLHFQFVVEGRAHSWWLRVFNTWGETVRDLGGDIRGPGPRDLIWDGRDDHGRPSAQGAYIVHLQLRGMNGSIIGNEKVLTAIRRGAD